MFLCVRVNEVCVCLNAPLQCITGVREIKAALCERGFNSDSSPEVSRSMIPYAQKKVKRRSVDVHIKGWRLDSCLCFIFFPLICLSVAPSHYDLKLFTLYRKHSTRSTPLHELRLRGRSSQYCLSLPITWAKR